MAVFYALGEAIVTEEELREKQVLGSVANFAESLNKERGGAILEFSTGRLTSKNIRKSIRLPNGEPTPFQEVGPGKPLTIEIRHVYTGRYPKAVVFDKTKDMLITSAMKSIATFDAAPRAVNFLEKNVRARHNISTPAATEKGTPLIHYTPALTEKNTVLTLEIGFDEFPEQIFVVVQNALTQAAGIPLFVSASTYLLAAGAITKLFGDIGSRVFDAAPVFKGTERLTFVRPGDVPPQADFRVLTNDDVGEDVFKDYKVGETGQLVDSGGNQYNGDTPYIVISLDGRKNDEYSAFSSTAASAALLDRFYSIKEGQEQGIGLLMDAVKLYNDWKFRKKADKLAYELKELDRQSEDYKKKKAEYDAAAANILEDILKPATEY